MSKEQQVEETMEEFFNSNYSQIDPSNLKYYFDKIPNNDDDYWMAKAMEYSPQTYRFLSDRLKRNKEYIQLAMEDDGSLMECVPDDLKDDDEVVRMAVQESSQCYQFISERLRDDEQILMAAIESSSGSRDDSDFLNYASDRLLDKEEIILSAIPHSSSAYCYASKRLRNDLNFAMDALVVDNRYHGRKEVGNYMSDSIRKQMGFLLED